MSPESLSLQHVSELIRLALTPAFLIAAVSSLLGVLSARLSRVSDIAAVLRTSIENGLFKTRSERSAALRNVSARAWLLLVAMALSVVCALLITLVIALLYVVNRGAAGLSPAIGLIFVMAIAVFAIAMMCVLAELVFASAVARNLMRDLAHEPEEPTAPRALSV
jgi:uncharacterized membrane protein